MTELKIEHVLMLAIVAFMLYHLLGSCGCRGNGFSVGACQGIGEPCADGCCSTLSCVGGYCIDVDPGPQLKKCIGVHNPENECESDPKCKGCKECKNTYIKDDDDNYRQCSHDFLGICTGDNEPCDPS